MVRTRALKIWEHLPAPEVPSLQQRVLHPEFVGDQYASYTRLQANFVTEVPEGETGPTYFLFGLSITDCTMGTPCANFLLYLLVLLLGVMGLGCGHLGDGPDSRALSTIDSDASAEARALYENLHQLSDEAVLFGHHDDLAYGVQWTRAEGRASDTLTSDVEMVTGRYPAVYGWDVARVVDWNESQDPEVVEHHQKWILEGYARGGVITMCWHMDNPVSGGDSWDTTRALPKILPDSSHHEVYVQKLDRFASFAERLDAGFWSWLGLGHDVPIIFRPFHEMNGDWFWWGNVSPATYKRLWRFTVRYLRDEKELNNLLYAYSPDVFDSTSAYLEYYPGDEYVDVLGYDDYHTLAQYNRLARLDTVAARSPAADAIIAWPGSDTLASGKAAPDSIGLDSVYVEPGRADSLAVAAMAENLRTVAREAERRGKVAAMTEGGLEGLPDPQWWTDRMLPALTYDSWTRRIAYISVWRNAPHTQIEGHFYAPYPGQKSAPDFRRFMKHPLIYFENDLPALYD